MSQSSRLGDVFFWLMVLVGAAVLTPCLILPAWIEYRASLELKVLRQQQVERRQAEVTKLRQQRTHLETDDAYVLRLAREHLHIQTPGVERIPVEPSPVVDGADPDAATAPLPSDEDELVPELSALVEGLVQRYPLAQMFVHPDTRPSLMFIGGGLIVAAIILLGIWPQRPGRTDGKAVQPTR